MFEAPILGVLLIIVASVDTAVFSVDLMNMLSKGYIAKATGTWSAGFGFAIPARGKKTSFTVRV